MSQKEKLYYSIYTSNEKIWIYADLCEVTDGCLVFYDIDDGGSKIPIMGLQQGSWQYFYEADAETGESIARQIPYWKRHDPRPNFKPR